MNFQESMTILNACTKKSGNLLNAPHVFTKALLVIILVTILHTKMEGVHSKE